MHLREYFHAGYISRVLVAGCLLTVISLFLISAPASALTDVDISPTMKKWVGVLLGLGGIAAILALIIRRKNNDDLLK